MGSGQMCSYGQGNGFHISSLFGKNMVLGNKFSVNPEEEKKTQELVDMLVELLGGEPLDMPKTPKEQKSDTCSFGECQQECCGCSSTCAQETPEEGYWESLDDEVCDCCEEQECCYEEFDDMDIQDGAVFYYTLYLEMWNRVIEEPWIHKNTHLIELCEDLGYEGLEITNNSFACHANKEKLEELGVEEWTCETCPCYSKNCSGEGLCSPEEEYATAWDMYSKALTESQETKALQNIVLIAKDMRSVQITVEGHDNYVIL